MAPSSKKTLYSRATIMPFTCYFGHVLLSQFSCMFILILTFKKKNSYVRSFFFITIIKGLTISITLVMIRGVGSDVGMCIEEHNMRDIHTLAERIVVKFQTIQKICALHSFQCANTTKIAPSCCSTF